MSRRDVTTASGPSRRSVLGAGVGLTGAAAVGLGGAASGQGFSGSSVAPQRPVRRVRYNDPEFLVHRITQGFTLADLEEARGLGWNGYLEWQLAHDEIDDSALDVLLAGYDTLSMTPREIFDTYSMTLAVAVQQLRQATVIRSISSRRQLFERMVQFWTDHFNIDHLDGECRVLKTKDDRDVIRQHALGNFRDLLEASARSAAMSFYLDNNANVALAPNENYARELMELHTLGVEGPYTETDVVEVARCFTGWDYVPRQQLAYGDFLFRPFEHDDLAKNVLGITIPAGGGENDGLMVLDILATHPSTADFISRKMIRWLLMYDPPQSLVDQVAGVFLATGGDIKEMIRTILNPATVAAQDPAELAKLRRPYHFLVSLVRAMGVAVTNANRLVTELGTLGQMPFAWPAPNGYPDVLEAWGASLMPRWGFASDFFDNRIQGVAPDVVALLQDYDTSTTAKVAAAVNHALTGGRLSEVEEAEIAAYLDGFPQLTLGVVREAFALATSFPNYQFY